MGSDERLEVNDVVHETRIEVNEEGSEAAGVTGILLDLRGGISETPEMTINRPLIIGKIASPSEAMEEEEVTNAEKLVSNRSNLPLSPEDLAHLRNNPEVGLHLSEQECLEQVEDYVNTNKVMFPCPPLRHAAHRGAQAEVRRRVEIRRQWRTGGPGVRRTGLSRHVEFSSSTRRANLLIHSDR